jgi:ethanolamine utilization protein EutN
MFLARVIGSVVSTRKEPSMKGRKLLLLRPMLVDEKDPSKLKPGKNTVVAVDALGAGLNDLVLFCQGSSARMADGMKELPIDAAVVGIADQVQVEGQSVYSARD